MTEELPAACGSDVTRNISAAEQRGLASQAAKKTMKRHEKTWISVISGLDYVDKMSPSL